MQETTPHRHKHHRPRDSHQRIVHSDNDAVEAAGQSGSRTPSKNNKKSDARKKSNATNKINGVHSDIGESGLPSHAPRYQINSGHSKATPIKNASNQAYAGGAFTNSPAPSALPIPPFFSKSVPTDIDLATDAPVPHAVQQLSKDRVHSSGQPRETTPLDWMFDLARNKDLVEPTRAPLLSPPSGTPSSRSPAARDGGIEFPFELDGATEGNKSQGTPFYQRLSAAATPRSTSLGGRPMTDEERKAKTDALKMRLLGDPHSPAPVESGLINPNPFNARNPTPRQPYASRHSSSNPSTPYQIDQFSAPSNPYFSNVPPSPTRANYNNNNGNGHSHRPQSSGLRNIYNPAHAPPSPPPSLVQDRHLVQPVQSPPRHANFAAIYGGAPRPSSSENGQASTTEDSLDNLRKMLNMSVIS